jgi:integrase
MASLQARHKPGCALGKEWSAFDNGDGCSCKPRYYVVVRQGKRNLKTAVGSKRADARKALTSIQAKLDEGAYRHQKNILFDAWADEWLDSLDGVKENTRDSYRPALDYAKQAFGWKQVRRLEPADVLDFLRVMEEAGTSGSTRAKHLRVIGECLSAAIVHGYAVHNPARELPKSQRPRVETVEAAYFENDELPRLFAQLPEGIYRALFETALKTGMRQGELLALRWGDVDLTSAVVHVRFNRTAGRTTDTKNRQRRNVDITRDVVDLLGRWWGEQGKPGDDALVFPGYFGSGYLSGSRVLKVLYAAMKDAGIPRVGPTGEKRTFHSFRHTFAKVALENHRPIAWVSRHIGHSSVQVTDGVYGHWGREARKAEMAEMEGAFSV